MKGEGGVRGEKEASSYYRPSEKAGLRASCLLSTNKYDKCTIFIYDTKI